MPTATVERIFTSIQPVIEENRAWGETNRNLAEPVVRAMSSAGVFQGCIPRAYGGLELSPAEAFDLVERVARVDGSAGWVTGNNMGFPYMCQLLEDGAAQEILKSPDCLIAGGGFPPGQAVPVDGGYRVSGCPAFGSGSHWATWLWSLNVILDESGPRVGPDGNPLLLWAFMHRTDADVLENWDTMGMRGTGSHDYRYENVFVPASRTFVLAPFDTTNPAFSGPAFRFGLWSAVVMLGAVGIGIAQAAVDEGIRVTEQKTPSYLASGLAENSAALRMIGRAAAEVGAARAYCYKAIDDIWQRANDGGRATLEDGVQVQLATSHAMDAGCRAVDLIHEVVGTSGIRTGSPLQQYFRDMHTISQHAFASAARFESAARVMLGQQSDWGFFYL